MTTAFIATDSATERRNIHYGYVFGGRQGNGRRPSVIPTSGLHDLHVHEDLHRASKVEMQVITSILLVTILTVTMRISKPEQLPHWSNNSESREQGSSSSRHTRQKKYQHGNNPKKQGNNVHSCREGAKATAIMAN